MVKYNSVSKKLNVESVLEYPTKMKSTYGPSMLPMTSRKVDAALIVRNRENNLLPSFSSVDIFGAYM